MKRILAPLFVFILILAVGAIVTARLGWWPVVATTTPPSWENAMMEPALRAALKRQAAGLTNPLSPTNEVLIGGMKIFTANCAGCHGTRGQPSSWGTRNFYPRVPQFADHAPKLTASQMFVAIKHGIRYSGMGAWNGMLSDEQIWKVATFLEKIDKLPPEIEAGWAQSQ